MSEGHPPSQHNEPGTTVSAQRHGRATARAWVRLVPDDSVTAAHLGNLIDALARRGGAILVADADGLRLAGGDDIAQVAARLLPGCRIEPAVAPPEPARRRIPLRRVDGPPDRTAAPVRRTPTSGPQSSGASFGIWQAAAGLAPGAHITLSISTPSRDGRRLRAAAAGGLSTLAGDCLQLLAGSGRTGSKGPDVPTQMRWAAGPRTWRGRVALSCPGGSAAEEKVCAALVAPPLRRSWRARPIDISEAELGCLLPGPLPVAPAMTHRSDARTAGDRAGIELGVARNADGGRAQPVTIAAPDLTRHMYILGPSGTGKTTLLAQLVLQLADRRIATCVLDPHGDLVEQIRSHLPAAVDPVDVDLTGRRTLPTFNPLYLADRSDERARAQRTGAVVDVFTDLYGLRRQSAPNLLHFLHAAVAALIAAPGRCLADLPRFLTDPLLRADIVRAGADRRVAARWAEFAALGAHDRSMTIRAIVNKAADFDRNPILGTVFGDPGPGLPLGDHADSGRLVLVDLARGLTPAGTGEVVGSFLLTSLLQHVMARQAGGTRPPIIAIIDEFQELALGQMAGALTAARKYGLGLVIANQNLSRVQAVGGADLVHTLLANTATTICFTPGAHDAPLIAPLFAPLTAGQLLAQRRYEFYLRTIAGPEPELVSGTTAPLAGRR